MTTLIASSPLWTDTVVAIATVVGVAGGLSALVFTLKQLKLQTRELEFQTNQERQAIEIRIAQRALDLMRLLVDIGRGAVEHPELRPYLHEGKELPRNEPLRSQVLAFASGFMSLIAEAVGWQIRAGQMGPDS